VIESASVHISSEWVALIRDYGLKFDTIVKRDRHVTINHAHGDVILEGQLVDVNSAVSDIKDAVSRSVRIAFDSWNRVNGSFTAAVDRSADKLNPEVARNDLMAGRLRPVVNMDVNGGQMTAAGRNHHVDYCHPVASSASLEGHESPVEIHEHVWRYISVIYPDMYRHWEQTLVPRLNSRRKTIEITGQVQEVINFNEWFMRHDLMAVVQRVINVHSSIDTNLLVGSSEADKFGVYATLASSTEMECIGRQNDIDGFIAWLKVALHEHKANGFSDDVEDSTYVNGSRRRNIAVNDSSHVNSPVASVSSETHKRPFVLHRDQDRLKFKTAESQLEVEVLQGDLTKQKTKVIVNPANKFLLHGGGAAKAIQTAAGIELIRECKDYIRKHKELPTSGVMHTTSGMLPRPIDYVIHACGPNARDHPDDKQCHFLLEKTFLNCFTYANDTLHMQSLALPAISSGIIRVLQ